MMNVKNLFSLFLLVISCFYFSVALTFNMYTKTNTPGNGFVPQIVGFILVVLTAYDFFRNYRNNQKETIIQVYIKELLSLIGIGILYFITFNILGALVSTILFTIVVLIIFNKGKWKQNLLIGLIAPTIIFFMFETLLQAGLPKGIFKNLY